MNFVIGLILLFLLLTAIKQFARMDAAAAARLVRHGGGVLGMIGALLLLVARPVRARGGACGHGGDFAGWRPTGAGWTPFAAPGSARAGPRLDRRARR